MDGWWCVRHGGRSRVGRGIVGGCRDATLVRPTSFRSWSNGVGDLVVFPQNVYPDNFGPHDYTRVVLNANPPAISRGRSQPLQRQLPLVLAFVAGLFALGFIHDVSAETWRGLIVAPEHRCAPYDKKRDYPYPPSVERDIVRALGAVYGP